MLKHFSTVQFFSSIVFFLAKFVCIYSDSSDANAGSNGNYLPIDDIKITTKTVGFEWETNCRHGQPHKCKGVPRRPYYFTASTITVNFNESIYLEGNQSATFAGSVRLICKERIFESFEVVPGRGDLDSSGLNFILESPPRHLVVINHRPNRTKSIHQLFSTRSSLTDDGYFTQFEAYLIMNFSVVHGFTHSYFSEEELMQCSIDFLPVDKQSRFSKVQMFVKKISSTRKEKRNYISGASKTFQFYRNQNRGQKEHCDAGEKKLDLALRLNMEKIFLSAALKNATKSGRLVSLAELSEADMMHLQTQWKETGTFMDAVSEIINPLISKIWEVLMGGFLTSEATQVSGMVRDESEDAVAENTHTTTQHILAPLIGGMLPEKVMNAVHEQLPDSIIEAVTAALHESVPTIITENLAPVLVTSLTESLSQSVSVASTQDMGEHLSRLASNSLTPTLGKSLTHSIVPTLLHTMSHNPMQDYYCFYCFHHKTYCQYCNYAPSQLYYATYYAGYYSTYYTNYYPEAFAAAEEHVAMADSMMGH